MAKVSVVKKPILDGKVSSELQKQFKKARVLFDDMEKLLEENYVPKGRKAWVTTRLVTI